MSNKVVLGLHLLVQILAQGAIVALIPTPYLKYFQATAVIVGLTVAFFDSTVNKNLTNS